MTEIFIIAGLILLNGLFSMAEIALVSVRKARLEAQANKGDKDAKKALYLSEHPDTFIATVQFVITLIGLLTGIFSGETIKVQLENWLQQFKFLQPYTDAAATGSLLIIITYLSLVLGELLPKRIGLSNPEGIAKLVAGPMQTISKITFPFIWFLNKSTQALTGILGIKRNDTQVTEEEIKAIINEGTDQGTIEEAEQEIIERVFHLSDRNITSLMTHRNDIIWFDAKLTIGALKAKLTNDIIHSVYPICEGKIDKIMGVVTIKDILLTADNALLSDVAQKPMYVPENNTAYQVLEKFKVTKIHHCFIVDEYGSVEGLITLNDILDAIVGDVSDGGEENYEIIRRTDGTYLADAQLSFYDFLTFFDKTEWIAEEESDDFNTIAGFILHKLQEIPTVGQKVSWRDFDIEIIDMDGHRIDKVLITLSDDSEG